MYKTEFVFGSMRYDGVSSNYEMAPLQTFYTCIINKFIGTEFESNQMQFD